jgi:hypothetical protein
MIKDIRIVQDHGWVQLPNGEMDWGPTRYWMEVQYEGSDEWKPLNVVNLNEIPEANVQVISH